MPRGRQPIDRPEFYKLLTIIPETLRSGRSFPSCHETAQRDLATTNKITDMKTIITTLGIIATATSLSFGQPAQGPGGPEGQRGPKGQRPAPEEVFAKLDADSSGSISLDEFKAGPRAAENPEKAAEIFAKIDADSDGSVTLEEFKAHRPERPRGQGKGRPEGGRPPVDAE